MCFGARYKERLKKRRHLGVTRTLTCRPCLAQGKGSGSNLSLLPWRSVCHISLGSYLFLSPQRTPLILFLSLSSITVSSVQSLSLGPTSRPWCHHQLSVLILCLPLKQTSWHSNLPVLLFSPWSTPIRLPPTSFHWLAHIKVTKDQSCQSQGQLQASLCWVLHRTEHCHFLILETYPLIPTSPAFRLSSPATPWGFFTGSKDFSVLGDPRTHPQLLLLSRCTCSVYDLIKCYLLHAEKTLDFLSDFIF